MPTMLKKQNSSQYESVANWQLGSIKILYIRRRITGTQSGYKQQQQKMNNSVQNMHLLKAGTAKRKPSSAERRRRRQQQMRERETKWINKWDVYQAIKSSHVSQFTLWINYCLANQQTMCCVWLCGSACRCVCLCMSGELLHIGFDETMENGIRIGKKTRWKVLNKFEDEKWKRHSRAFPHLLSILFLFILHPNTKAHTDTNPSTNMRARTVQGNLSNIYIRLWHIHATGIIIDGFCVQMVRKRMRTHLAISQAAK